MTGSVSHRRTLGPGAVVEITAGPMERATTDNLAVVQGIYLAFAGQDIASIVPMLDPDVEWREPPNPLNPAAGCRRGHEGFLEWARVGRDAEEVLGLEARRFSADGDTVAVVGHARCRARRTGAEYETDFVHLVELRGGKVIRFQEFFDTYAVAEAFRPRPAVGGTAALRTSSPEPPPALAPVSGRSRGAPV